VDLSTWVVTLRRKDANLHVYNFPRYVQESAWVLEPGEKIYLHTGVGNNQFLPAPEPHFNLYMNRRRFSWNHPGEMICLYRRNTVTGNWDLRTHTLIPG